MNSTMHLTTVAVQGSGSAASGTAGEESSSLCVKLKRLIFASGDQPASLRRSSALALLALLAFGFDVSSFVTSVFQAPKALKYLQGTLELLLGGILLFVAVYGALSRDVRYAGIYALGGLLKSIYQVVQIVFGVFAVQTFEEELGRVEETQANPSELQLQVALSILRVLLDAADCLAYGCSTVASVLLRERILETALVHMTDRFTTIADKTEEGSQGHQA